MPRRVEEWIGKTDDTWPPSNPCKRRIMRAAGGICGVCGLRVLGNGDIDHKIPVWKGSGLNRESNLQYVHKLCHRSKSSEEATERAKSDRTFDKLHGITRSKRWTSRKKPKPEQGRWVGYDLDLDGIPKRLRWVKPGEE
jgi:5-methylcytosine-specific restriction protein A